MKSFIFGETSTGLPIPAYSFGTSGGTSGSHVMIIGGVHGDEIEGVWCAHGLLKSFAQGFPFKLRLTLVPALNLDGVLARERRNGRGVDLNRNLPTRDWTSEVSTERYNPGPSPGSESESQALMRFLETDAPQMIFSLHSWKPMLNVNGDCRPEANEISRLTGYSIEESIGYPTPGCLGTYAGLERAMPTLTYEIERGLAQDRVLGVHVPAIIEALKVTEQRGPL